MIKSEVWGTCIRVGNIARGNMLDGGRGVKNRKSGEATATLPEEKD